MTREVRASKAATREQRGRRSVPARERRSGLQLTAGLVRFISCGVLSVGAGAAWRLSHSGSHVTIGGALADVLILFAGFALGGVLWLARDLRVRSRAPEQVSDENLVFSFVVFAAVPLGVLVLIGAVWLLSLLIGLA
jgi:hypothetical protein